MLFDTFSEVNVFPGCVGQFGHARRCVCRFFWRFCVKARVHGDGGTEVGKFVDYHESVVADFDFRGMADILGTHIGFLEADFEAKVYTCAGEFGDEPLQCCLEMRCEGSIVSEEQVTHKYSFDFGFGAEASHVEEFTVGQVWRYTPSGIKGVGQEERGEDSKKCRG